MKNLKMPFSCPLLTGLQAFVFVWAISLCLSYQSHAQWIQIGSDIDGEAAGDRSGSSISMPDVNTIAIGARSNGGNGIDAGHVRIYSRIGGVWVQKGNDIDGEAINDLSGIVSMPDTNTVAIGAMYNAGTATNAGHVRIFEWNGSDWVQKGSDINGEAAYDLSGISVSMPDANTIAVGASLNDGGGYNSGHVRVFEWNGSAWVQKGTDINGETAGDESGYCVSMPDNNTVAIGARSNDGNGSNSGHVRIYSWNGSLWVQKGADIDGEAAGDQSGESISMPDANTVAIGARENDGNGSNSGHVRIYSWNGNAWVQKGGDIDGESPDDYSGYWVSMPDVNTVAVGAAVNDGNGNEAGHVRIFRWTGNAWVQKGLDIDGEAAGDQSGWSVSMPDSATVAIGAPYNDGNGPDAGHVRVYESGPSTGMVEYNEGGTVTVYPNPAAGEFTIQSSSYNIERVEIITVTGEKVYNSQLDTKIFRLNTDLPDGIYFIHIITGQGITTEKLVIHQ